MPQVAHIVIEGAGDLANGAVHPFVTPTHGLVLLALGLLVGMQRPRDFRPLVWGLVPFLAIGLAATTVVGEAAVDSRLLAGLALVLGAAVALDRPIPLSVLAILGGAAGLAVGLDSRVEGLATSETWKTLVGTWLGATLAVFYITACVASGGEKPWVRTAVRIVGSWLVAISLMVLAFAMRA